MKLSPAALALFGLMALGALAGIVYGLQTMQSVQVYRFGVLLVLAVVTARLKVKLPGLTGCMSVCLPFLLISVAELTMLEALLVALSSCTTQCLPKGGGKPKPVQMILNLSTMDVATATASLIGTHFSPLLGAVGFFLAQTLPVSGIISLTEGGVSYEIWSGIARQTFPFYVLSAGITSIATSSAVQSSTWQVPLLSLPVLYAIYRSYQSYFQVEALGGR
jgi:hypothetical protein